MRRFMWALMLCVLAVGAGTIWYPYLAAERVSTPFEAAELLEALCPALSGDTETVEDAYAETVIENGAVRSITVSAAVAIQNGSAPQFPDKAVSALTQEIG